MRTAALIFGASIFVLALTLPHRLVADNTDQTAHAKITKLQTEREKLVAQFGKNHPSVKMLEKQIAAIISPRPTVSRQDVTKMDDVELRRTVEQLLSRVSQLENAVAELKSRRPKTELLKR